MTPVHPPGGRGPLRPPGLPAATTAHAGPTSPTARPDHRLIEWLTRYASLFMEELGIDPREGGWRRAALGVRSRRRDLPATHSGRAVGRCLREGEMTPAHQGPAGMDRSRPTPARIYDYMLGGNNNFPADQQAAEQILEAVPEVRDAA